MNKMRLSSVADVLDGQLVGADCEFDSVSIDSRSTKEGDLFIALRGDNFDGHDFMAEAAKKGAVAAMVTRKTTTDLTQLIVADTRLGLGRIAAIWRERFPGPVVAVTGSNGKTTVKELLASIFKQSGPVLATVGNLNNEIGVPLTLLRLREIHEAAVIEMGASAAGDISYLTNLTQPTVALITNAAPAHLQGFGSVEDVAKAKGEIYQGLEDGVAVINADDKYAALWHELAAEHRQFTFGLHTSADVTVAGEVGYHFDAGGFRTEFIIRTPNGSITVTLRLAGEHNVRNALAATAAAIAAGVGLNEIKAGLEAVTPVAGRFNLKAGKGKISIIDDTYNANPGSLLAAIKVLATLPGQKALVLGDMAELGPQAETLHAAAGTHAREYGIQTLYATGLLSKQAVAAFGNGGHWFATQPELIAALQNDFQGDNAAVLLLKGSRSSQMNKVVDALTEANSASDRSNKNSGTGKNTPSAGGKA